jgi:hypothetical protein
MIMCERAGDAKWEVDLLFLTRDMLYVQYVRYDCLPEMIYLVGSRLGLFKLIYFILFQ